MNVLRLTRLVAGLICACATTLAIPALASAGSYVMRSCNVPGERPTPVVPWKWIDTPGTFANNDCATGGGFGINAGPMGRTEASGIVIESPNGGSAIAIRRVRLWMVARLSGAGSMLFVAAVSGAGGVATSENLFGPPGGDTLTTPHVSPVLAPGTTNYIIFLSCSGDTPDGCTPSNTNVLDIKGVEVTLEESVLPTASVVGGELMSPGPQSGIRGLGYSASDLESGVAKIAVVMGGTAVGGADFAADCPHADFAACPSQKDGSIAVDTRKVPDGTYPVALRVTDAAGNERTVQAASVVQVANGAASSTSQSSGSSGSRGVQLNAWFVTNRRTTVTTNYGRRVVIRGRLTGPTGQPIGGARIKVSVRPATAHPKVRNSVVVTSADGSFSYLIARRSSSRAIRLEYHADADATTAAVRRLTLRVRAASTLRVTLHGVRVNYRGRVLTRPIPRAGKLVFIQGRAPGSAWKTFAQRRTNARGNFSGVYQLRVHRPGVRLQFRVRVPTEPGYPFAGRVGRAVAKVVR